MRRLVLLSLPLAAAAVVPASAAPVDVSRLAVAGFTVPTYGGAELQVTVRAIDGADRDVVRVAVSRCDDGDCAFPRYYEGTLPDGALRLGADAASGRLEAVVGGLALTVVWTPLPDGSSTVVVGGIEGGGRDTDNSLSTYRAEPAAAAVSLPSGDCAGRGAVGDEVRASTGEGGDGSAAPLAKLRLRALGAPTCGD